MRRTSLVRLAATTVMQFLLLGIAPEARAQEGPQPPPPFEQVYQMPVVYEAPGMDKVQVRRDIVYKTVETPKGKAELKLDLYLPARAKKGQAFPAVVLISGGGIEGGDHDWRNAGVYQSYSRILAASGFAGIAFSKRYARGPEGTLNGIEDLNDLVGYLRGHADEVFVDKDRLAFWGFSAGGLLLAPVLKEGASFGRAVVCFYCVSDIERDSWAGVEGVTEESLTRARTAGSSVEQIQTAGHPLPPIFVGRAGWDSPGLNRGIDKLVLAALGKNAMIEVMSHPAGRHGFDIIDSDERCREIIRHALEFLKVHLVGG
jgi:acetyl esterase/lipase